MRITVLTGIFAFVVVVAASGSTASAETPRLVIKKSLPGLSYELDTLVAFESKITKPTAEPAEAKPSPTIHEVAANENLSLIAEQHNTTWKRLFDKNTQIAHPDILVVGDQITVPLLDEQLTERALPEPPVVAPAPAQAASPSANYNYNTAYSAPAASATVSRGSSAGNTYTAGYCTWYAKNMRPDLPNNLGNADTWVARAAAQGLPTGSSPRVGAIGQQGMHVVYVQSVNGDGTVTISEMNYGGLYRISSRTVPASTFMYIY